MIQTEKIGSPRSGTGDIFAAIIAADAVNGTGLTESVRKASGFIGKCIQRSVELEILWQMGSALKNCCIC